MDLYSLLLTEFLGNPIHQYLWALVVFGLMYFGLKTIMHYITYRVKKRINTSRAIKKELLMMIRKIPIYFFLTIEVFVALQILNIHPTIGKIIRGIFIFVVVLQAVHIISTLILLFLNPLLQEKHRSEKQNKTVQNALKNAVFIIVRIIGAIFFIDNLGIEITPLLMSLGLASIVVAFALKSILEDIFSSFSIIFAPSFKVGDYIELEKGKAGVIQNITLKNTRIKETAGNEIIVPNRIMLEKIVRNYGSWTYRRKRVKLLVSYNTPVKKLEKIPSIIQTIIKKEKMVDYERTYLKNMGDYASEYLISYVIRDTDYEVSLEIGERIYLSILRQFEKEGIEIAIPTQKILK